jgi:hypothetical protein
MLTLRPTFSSFIAIFHHLSPNIFIIFRHFSSFIAPAQVFYDGLAGRNDRTGCGVLVAKMERVVGSQAQDSGALLWRVSASQPYMLIPLQSRTRMAHRPGLVC